MPRCHDRSQVCVCYCSPPPANPPDNPPSSQAHDTKLQSIDTNESLERPFCSSFCSSAAGAVFLRSRIGADISGNGEGGGGEIEVVGGVGWDGMESIQRIQRVELLVLVVVLAFALIFHVPSCAFASVTCGAPQKCYLLESYLAHILCMCGVLQL
jgi:hypothetical protein